MLQQKKMNFNVLLMILACLHFLCEFGESEQKIEWVKCPPVKFNLRGIVLECSNDLSVPLKWDSPNGTQIDLFVSVFRHDATKDHKGNIILLNGGPGESGQSSWPLIPSLWHYFGGEYDVYTPDHRGTGNSTFIYCPFDSIEKPECTQHVLTAYDINFLNGFNVDEAAMDLHFFVEEIEKFNPKIPLYIYAHSYGSYLLNRYMLDYPNEVNGFIYDGVCPPDADGCRFALHDEITNKIGKKVMNLCENDNLCRNEFKKYGLKPLDALNLIAKEIKSGKNDCFNNNNIAPNGAPNLNLAFLGYIRGFFNKPLLPAFIKRVIRCNEDDVKELRHWMSVVSRPKKGPSVSGVLGLNILLSELFYGKNPAHPPPPREYFEEISKKSNFGNGNMIKLRSIWDMWPRYDVDMTRYNKFAMTDRPLLMMTGDLDSNTPFEWSEHSLQYYKKLNKKNILLVKVPRAIHGVIGGSPTSDGVACGAQLLKSFLINNGDLNKMDVSCTNRVLNIDWKGNDDITKSLSKVIFGTKKLWGNHLSSQYWGHSYVTENGGNKIFSESVGYANYEFEIGFDENIKFSVGSNTKLFTSVLLHQFHEDKIIDLKSSISNYLDKKDFKKFGLPNQSVWCPKIINSNKCETVTFYDILAMRSGIVAALQCPYDSSSPLFKYCKSRCYFTSEYSGSVSKYISEFINAPLQFKPGTQFTYSNPGYVLLGYLIEKITGISFGENIKRRIVDKIGLSNTYYDPWSESFVSRLNRSDGYYLFGDIKNDKRLSVGRCAPYTSSGITNGASGIVSTSADMHKWFDELFNPNKETILFKNPQTRFDIIEPISKINGPTNDPWYFGLGVRVLKKDVNSQWPDTIYFSGITKCFWTVGVLYPNENNVRIITLFSNTKHISVNAKQANNCDNNGIIRRLLSSTNKYDDQSDSSDSSEISDNNNDLNCDKSDYEKLSLMTDSTVCQTIINTPGLIYTEGGGIHLSTVLIPKYSPINFSNF